MRTADWKNHYSSMDEEMQNSALSQARRDCGLPDMEQSLPPIVAKTLAENSLPEKKDTEEGKGLLSKRDARILLSVRELISSHLQREEQSRRSCIITTIDPNQFQLSPTSTESRIAQILRGNDAGLHLNEIIVRLEQSGWTTTSVHHKYAEVYAVIRKHYYMFEKVGKAKFRLREAFSQRPAVRRVPAVHQVDSNKHIITIKDIIVGVMKKFYAPPGLYPSVVWGIMRRMGYDCTYSAVHKAMQDEKKFDRDGFFYALASNANKKSAKQGKRT